MGDKDPRHPLKKKKEAPRFNMTAHEGAEVQEAAGKHNKKKHVY